ncbi:MAG: hypothetical protein PHV91_07995 [Bacteroidales bacterium]|nr:hypothetical protein [Bacteroidales bacterium]MDD3914872.1 hypothetical protein [Bacteroidales bacterium]
MILHSTLLKLVGANNNELFITGWPVVTYYSNQIWNVNSVVLFVPENEIEIFENNRIAIKNDNLLINWEGALYNKDKNEIVFDCN